MVTVIVPWISVAVAVAVAIGRCPKFGHTVLAEPW
jgi:hypothetical protein